VLQRVADYCDGWMPIGARLQTLVQDISDLRERAEKAGRDPKSVSVSIFGGLADEAVISGYRDAGVERVAFGLPSADRDSVLRRLDRYAEFTRKFA
jgi:alkanesulfonate monooxygenase SsuD/methylene tetrahydromethanopterin reductase-like flavin-dependent oxidoreductase (luciferase family)